MRAPAKRLKIPRPIKRVTATERLNFKNVNLRYSELLGINAPSASASTSYRFRANSGYDPNKTGTGHQPMGWTEYTSLYDRYVINGAKITVKTMWQSASSGGPLWIALGLQSSAAAWSTIQNARENGANVGVLAPYTCPMTSLDLVSTYSAKKQYGLSSEMLRASDKISALIGASPVNIEDFQILFEASNVTPSSNLTVLVEIDYNVTFFDVKRNMPEDS